MTAIEELFGARTTVVVEDVIRSSVAATVRALLDAIGYERYALVDRGSYDHVAIPPPTPGHWNLLYETLAEIEHVASSRLGRELHATEPRALRLRAGDYLLAHHDRVHEGHPIEAVLDLSATPAPSEIHYRRRGQVFYRVPCVFGSLALVERGPTVTSNHTYVSKLHPDAEIVRIVALLRER